MTAPLPFRLLAGHHEGEPVGLSVGPGYAWLYSAVDPHKETENEDAATAISLDGARGVLAVADGAGGHRSAAAASRMALELLGDRLISRREDEETVRSAVLDAFEEANHRVRELGVGAMTTLAVVELDGDLLRPYHVGDSAIWVIGQRGRSKLQTISHSPVGYAREAGLLSEDEARAHEDRHVVSNFVGADDMRIEVGSALRLAPRDTVLIASDGLFDNLDDAEIVELIRCGSLDEAVSRLAGACRHRMDGDGPGKPDDLTFILFRLRAG